MGAVWRGHKRYFLEYKSDKRGPGIWDPELNGYNRNLHEGGRANSLKTIKAYIRGIRQDKAEESPHDFKVYDSYAENEGPAPCVYQEN